MMKLIFSLLAFTTFVIAPVCVYADEHKVTDERLSAIYMLKDMPEHEVFCLAEDWSRGITDDLPDGVIPPLESKYRKIISKEFLALFMWAHCVVPENIRPLRTERSFYWDFRYGTQAMGGSNYVENIRIGKPQISKDGKLSVSVLWDDGDIKNTWTRYTLVKENDSWKIDDIALKGYSIDMGTEGMEETLPSSKSLKTELQAAYKRAEEKYNREKAGKGAASK